MPRRHVDIRPIDLLEGLAELGLHTAADVLRLAPLVEPATAAALERIAAVLGATTNNTKHTNGIQIRVIGVIRGENRRRMNPQREALIREKHALGWTDTTIGSEAGVRREAIGEQRRALGLPSNALSDWRRRQVAERTKQQCQEAGVKSLADVRRLAFRKYARDEGWPDDLRPRQVQILNAIYERGPLTKRQLCDVLGMPWKGSGHRTTFVSNAPGDGGSYLAGLLRRGLLISITKAVRGEGPQGGKYAGHTPCNLYLIPLHIKRGGPWHETQSDAAGGTESPTAGGRDLPSQTA